MARTVSPILLEDYRLLIRPGKRGMSQMPSSPLRLKADDSLGEVLSSGLWLLPHNRPRQWAVSV